MSSWMCEGGAVNLVNFGEVFNQLSRFNCLHEVPPPPLEHDAHFFSIFLIIFAPVLPDHSKTRQFTYKKSEQNSKKAGPHQNVTFFNF